MYTKQELLDRLKCQLAIEFNCTKDDFTKRENIITESVNNKSGRQYTSNTHFFRMVTLGGNAIISVDPQLHSWLSAFAQDKSGHWLFEHNRLRVIDDQLQRYNKELGQTHHMFLPNMNLIPVDQVIPVKWYEQSDIDGFYTEPCFFNALSSKYNPLRPDVLAVAAYDGDNIIALAGCSADTSELWQIGIDVNEDYRGKGLGTYLVRLLKDEIIHRGKIPFYGTSLSNLHSWNIALNSGFFPAWVEVETVEE